MIFTEVFPVSRFWFHFVNSKQINLILYIKFTELHKTDLSKFLVYCPPFSLSVWSVEFPLHLVVCDFSFSYFDVGHTQLRFINWPCWLFLFFVSDHLIKSDWRLYLKMASMWSSIAIRSSICNKKIFKCFCISQVYELLLISFVKTFFRIRKLFAE